MHGYLERVVNAVGVGHHSGKVLEVVIGGLLLNPCLLLEHGRLLQLLGLVGKLGGLGLGLPGYWSRSE